MGRVVRAHRYSVGDERLWMLTRNDDGRWEINTEGRPVEFDQIPTYLKTRLALLLMCPIGFRQEDLGRRVSKVIFWIFYRAGEEDGTDKSNNADETQSSDSVPTHDV